MRGPGLLLRVLVLAVLLPVTAAGCIVILIGSGALHPRLSHMVAAGGAIFIIATLAAALSTFSPKFRPTPLLTPLLAGVFAALVATAGLYGAQAYIATKNRPVAATAQAKPVVVPVKPAADEKAAQGPIEPDPRMAAPQPAPAATDAPQPIPASAPAAASSEPAAAPNFDGSAFAPADALSNPPATAGAPTAPSPAAADAPQPAAATPPAAQAPTDQSVTADSAGANQGKPAASDDANTNTLTIANIPVPAAAPTETLPRQTAPTQTATPDPNAPLNLDPRFDPSGPNGPQADGPPMALAGGGATTASHRSAIPPLPRIRPCGGAGPACP
jgi:hypothetical protein